MKSSHAIVRITFLTAFLLYGTQAMAQGVTGTAAEPNPQWFIAKLTVISMLWLLLPLLALSYQFYRRPRRQAEIDRVFKILNLDDALHKSFQGEGSGLYLAIAVAYTSIVNVMGLALLMFAGELGVPEFPFLPVGGDGNSPVGIQFPIHGSRLVLAMAFLGGYVWGIQHLLTRYSQNDLLPVVYYQLASRTILAGVVSVALYNGYSALMGGGDQAIGMSAWPAIALLIGMFPKRGLLWLTERVPFLAARGSNIVTPAPLDMIEGVQADVILRLDEMGIRDCYNLARYDFIPMVLKTPYTARELLDWILQAKLCALFPEGIVDLRHNGVRTATDLLQLNDEDIVSLSAGTTLTERGLTQGREVIRRDNEMDRLQSAAAKLGRYLHEPEDSPPAE